MIKKLGLLICLGLAAQAPLAAGYYGENTHKEAVELATITAGVTCVAGMLYFIVLYPQFFGEFAGVLMRGLADRHYCYHCDSYCHGHRPHYHYPRVQVTTYY